MNGQQRSSPTNFAKLNLVKQIIELKNYRDYERILFISPAPGTYLGYLDGNFFGFSVPEGWVERGYYYMDAKEAVDYYLNNFSIIFRNPSLEYISFIGKYKPYMTALKFKLDGSDKN